MVALEAVMDDDVTFVIAKAGVGVGVAVGVGVGGACPLDNQPMSNPSVPALRYGLVDESR